MSFPYIGYPYCTNPNTKRKKDHTPFKPGICEEAQAQQGQAGDQQGNQCAMNGAQYRGRHSHIIQF